jgi:hypothetical protein
VTTALTTPSHLISLPLGELYQLGKTLLPTGFLPSTIKTPEQAVAIMIKGQELRIPPMYALSNIVVIQGKPAANAELMLALIYRDHGDDAIIFTETSAMGASISYKRRSWKERQVFSFTSADAKTAGLSGGNWSKYPAAMLRARCISAVARLAFPDTIGGMYTPEELGLETDAGEEGATYTPRLVDKGTGELLDAPSQPMATDKQRNYITGLQDKLGWHSGQVEAYARERGVDVASLTAAGASTLIEGLEALSKERGKAPERPLVKRLRELVGECRSAGVPIPDLPRPRDMTDEQLDAAIQSLEIEYSKAQQAAEQVHEDLSDDALFNEPVPVRGSNRRAVEDLL